MKKGIVIKTTGSWHTVRDENNIVLCKIRGTFRKKDIKTTNPIAVGDIVHYEYMSDKTAIITHIEPRKNYIIRRSSNLSKESHIIASNIDQAYLMISVIMPETPLEFVDRFLLTAEAYHVPVIIIINKIDLIENDSIEKVNYFMNTYRGAGYECIDISVKQNKGIDLIKDRMKNKINLLAGNSGVGKSSLINLICPDANLKTGEISLSHKTGKHITTYAEMIPLPEGGFIIDTPGIRGFGIIDISKQEVGLYFTDIFRISKNCEFNNCTHIHEPGCAVIEAVKSGKLPMSRYQSYINIYNDPNEKYRTG